MALTGLNADELVDWLFSREEMITGMNLEMAELREKYPEDASLCREGRRQRGPERMGLGAWELDLKSVGDLL